MTPFPPAYAEIAELRRLRGQMGKESPGDDAGKALRGRIDQLVARLGSPVRVAILGGPRSGKSSLVNFLAGADLIPTDAPSSERPPVIVRFNEKPMTAAGWWSGIEVAEDGFRLEAAALHSPDFIEFRLPNPILKFMSFLDMPSVGTGDAQTEQVRWVSSRADIIVWCGRANAKWEAEELPVLAPAADRLKGRSLLVVTHTDLLAGPEIEALAGKLKGLTAGLFQAVRMISTARALKASPEGKVIDPAGWEASGGRNMAATVLAFARAVRNSEIATARKLLKDARDGFPAAAAKIDDASAPTEAEAAAPAEPEVPQAAPEPAPEPAREPEPAPVAATEPEATAPEPEASPEAEPVAPVPTTPEPVTLEPSEPEPEPVVASEPAPAEAASPAVASFVDGPESGALAALQARLDEMIAYTVDEAAFRDWGFLNLVVETADEVSNAVAPRTALTEEAAWLRSQVDDAFGEFNMMQMGGTEQHCVDAARLLLQLARDLSWAATREEA